MNVKQLSFLQSKIKKNICIVGKLQRNIATFISVCINFFYIIYNLFSKYENI